MQNLYKCTEGVVAKLSQRRQSKQLQTMIFVNIFTKYISYLFDVLINIDKLNSEWKFIIKLVPIKINQQQQ
jgi:hypothetical protein